MTTILIVDDDSMVLESTQAYLETQNFDILCAKNGNEARAKLKSESIDLALIDLFMPSCGGLEIIKTMHKDVPIIAMSGMNTQGFEALSFAQSLGAHQTLSKPFHPKELLEAIQVVLSKQVA